MIITANVQAALNNKDIVVQWFVRIEPLHRTTNERVAYNFWTGPETLTVTIDGLPRTYVGFGDLIEMPDFTYQEGLNAQQQKMMIGALSQSALELLRLHEPRGAPIQVHAAIFDRITTAYIGAISFLDGRVNTVNIVFDEGEAYAEVSAVTSVYEGSITLQNKKSNQSQRKVDPTDTFRQYGSISSEVNVAWGVDGANVGRHKVTRPPRV